MINLTESAATHIASQMESRGHGIGIRLGVRSSGCSGLSYILEFADQLAEDDEVFTYDNVSLVVDKKSLIYLDGTELDLVTEGLNSGLQFRNPNVSGECGCGESFSV